MTRRTRHRQLVTLEGVDPALASWAELARADLAGRLGLPLDRVVVEAAGSVTWSDASCGCPADGMRYIQIPVDGAYARLVVNGRIVHYHGSADRRPFACED